MKLRCRVETAEPLASASWLRFRRRRHSRSKCPGPAGSTATAMPSKLPRGRAGFHDLRASRRESFSGQPLRRGLGRDALLVRLRVDAQQRVGDVLDTPVELLPRPPELLE